jgi:hypothetical protein
MKQFKTNINKYDNNNKQIVIKFNIPNKYNKRLPTPQRTCM